MYMIFKQDKKSKLQLQVFSHFGKITSSVLINFNSLK